MLFDLLKSQRTSRGIRGWHCCVVPVKFHTEEKILHDTHTHTHTIYIYIYIYTYIHTHTNNECTNASKYLLKQTPINFFFF